MPFEIDSLSYTLLASIFGAASMIAVKNGNYPDVHPLILNSQSEVSQLRHPGESATLRSKLYPNGPTSTAPTLREFYEDTFNKHKSNTFLGEEKDNKLFWVNRKKKMTSFKLILNN